jgi:CRP-like cAMP-binding protein
MKAFDVVSPLTVEPVIRRMEASAPVTAEQRHRVEMALRRTERVATRSTLMTEHEATARPRYILAGWAMRQRLLADGRRQIFSFLLPGDGVGVCLRPSPIAMATTVALTPMQLVDATDLVRPATLEDCPEIGQAVAKAAAFEESLLLGHIVRLGRQTAFERVAHFFLELRDRLKVVGLSHGDAFEAPFTQEVLADALGLSVVHINRTLQQLRRERMISMEGGRVTLLAPELLAATADYTPLRPS